LRQDELMSRAAPPERSFRRSRGFTLVEMSVVLVIIGLLILTVFPALTAARLVNQRSATQSNLQSLMLAAASFVQANGCLPCPTPASATGAGFGRVRGDTATKACNGCATAEGIPPFVSLGIAPNLAHDGWGNWISMRVDPALTASALGGTVPPATPCGATDLAAPVTPTCTLLNASQKGLCQSGLAAANRVSVQTPGGAAQQAAVLFISYGSKGYGSLMAAAQPIAINFNGGCRLNFPGLGAACLQSLSCASPSAGAAYAACNADGKNQFYNAAMQDGYDDMLAFADRNTLVSMLGNGASCQTVW
jgi:prepilin-type N-terminal cleavage/methylation domain-containing protein